MNLEEVIENQHKEIHDLKSQLRCYQSELNTYQKRCEQYAEAYDALQHQVNELLRHRFGKKSERFIDPENPQQNLFEGAASFSAADATGDAIKDDI